MRSDNYIKPQTSLLEFGDIAVWSKLYVALFRLCSRLLHVECVLEKCCGTNVVVCL
jgi:hypothetical protein